MTDDYRKRVLDLARQIEDLSRPGTEEDVFFPGFLSRLLSPIGAAAGMIWLASADGTMDIRAEQGLTGAGYHRNSPTDQTNAFLLDNALNVGKSQMFGVGEVTALRTPTNHLYIVIPLMVGANCLGIVEILQRPNTDPRARPGYLMFIEQMCGYATRYIHLRKRLT